MLLNPLNSFLSQTRENHCSAFSSCLLFVFDDSGTLLPALGAEARRRAAAQHHEIVRALEEQRYDDMPSLTLALADQLLDEVWGDDVVTREAKLALSLFTAAHAEGKAVRPDVFSVVCLGVIVDTGL